MVVFRTYTVHVSVFGVARTHQRHVPGGVNVVHAIANAAVPLPRGTNRVRVPSSSFSPLPSSDTHTHTQPMHADTKIIN